MIAIITKSVIHFECFIIDYLREVGDEVQFFNRKDKAIESKNGLRFLMVDNVHKSEGCRFTGYKIVQPCPADVDDILQIVARRVVLESAFSNPHSITTSNQPTTETDFWKQKWFDWLYRADVK